jgi:hypothetical protein
MTAPARDLTVTEQAQAIALIPTLLEELRAVRSDLAAVKVSLRAAVSARGLSPAEYATQHSVSVWTVRRRIADGTLPHQRIGKRIVISADAVQSPENHSEIERMAAEARGR